jgi:DinB superfamily
MPERKRRIEEWLGSSRRFLLSVVGGMKDEDWQRVAHDDPAQWTARDVLAHVVGAEPSLVGIITRAQAEGRYTPRPDFDLDFWNRRQVEKRAEKSLADLAAELDRNRVATLKLLADLPEPALDFPVRHPSYGDMIVEDVFRLIGFHERLHADEIRAVTAET